MPHIITIIKDPKGDDLIHKEWLMTNALGGFASGSISNVLTRKYHALLIAALHAPLGRTILLNHVEESIIQNKKEIILTQQRQGPNEALPDIPLTEFKLKDGIPFWYYKINDTIIEKRLHLINHQNTVHITYQIMSGKPVHLKWHPFLHFRNYESPVNISIPQEEYSINSHNNRYEISCPTFPLLRMLCSETIPFTPELKKLEKVYYEYEAARGYESIGSLISPGCYSIELIPNKKITFVVSAEDWETIEALSPAEAWQEEKLRRKNVLKTAGLIASSLSTISNTTIGKLVFAADQFIFKPITRFREIIRLQAAGEEPGSVVAGFPWFTDWGRDTMISLEGLTLSTGRTDLAYSILRTFAHYVKDGLIPNMFPDKQNEALYHTADATLWFFHATDRYLQTTQDFYTLELLIPKFKEIIEHHLNGTRFGIKVDKDGLLSQGANDLQLTWMDAKVGDWVVTPRRGKAVEINALWYNALRLMEEWTGKYGENAEHAKESFNQKFWYPEGNYLYDVIDCIDHTEKKDSSLRPNQIFSISLKHPVLEINRWQTVVDIIHKELLTPVGLRTLSPTHPDFKATYEGDLRSRDAAYHQGTVWPWLIGHFIDAWLKVYPDDFENARCFLKGLEEHLNHTCVGNIAEIFDATPPYNPRGCFAQAWSVAEVLRSLIKVGSKG